LHQKTEKHLNGSKIATLAQRRYCALC